MLSAASHSCREDVFDGTEMVDCTWKGKVGAGWHAPRLSADTQRRVTIVEITHQSKRLAISALKLRRGRRIACRCIGGMGRCHGDRGKIEVAIATLSFDALVRVRLDEAGVSFSLDEHDDCVKVDEEESTVKVGILWIG